MRLNKRNILRWSVAITCFILLALVAPGVRGATLIVSNSATPCPRATFTHIQDAINAAAPGDEIIVCSGTYAEQLSISKSLSIRADSGVFLAPSPIQQNATSLATGNGIAAAVLVDGATNVSITGLAVDGIGNGITACAPQLIGVYFRNSSGSLRHATIRNFKLSPALNGCQSGTAVFVQSGGGISSDVEIADSSIHDYQKNGITANEAGTTAQIHGNVVTGVGPTTGAAQNGIQIGFAAVGTIRRNTVANNFWSPCMAVETCQAVATGILVTQSDGVTVSGNTAGIDQVGVFVDGNNATLQSNKAYAASVFENIRIEGNGSQITGNDAVNGGEADIFIQGNNNSVVRNSITEAPVGILEAHGSSGNAFTGNKFFSVGVTVQDPFARSMKNGIVPDR